MSKNANAPEALTVYYQDTQRDAFQPFYLTIIETNPGKFELGIDPGVDFDTREEAEAYLKGEVDQYGVGGHVYHCVRVSGMSMADDEDPAPPG